MKKIIFLSFMSLIIMATALTSLAAPTQAYVVSSVAETANDSTDDTLANVADEYVPTKDEYENLQYGEVIFWQGYEGITAGTKADSTPAFINSSGSSGVSSYINSPSGTVSEDTELGIKYATVSGTQYLTFYGKNAKAGTYTLVIRARKGTDSSFTAYIRGKGPKASDPTKEEDKNWASKSFTLTDEFTECVVSYNYTPGDAGYLNQTLPLFGNGVEIDSYAVYYKPFNDNERPQYGELVAWEGYETRAIGSKASGNAAVVNSSNTSGVSGIGFPGGYVYAESPSGNRYVVTEGTSWPGISGGQTAAKAGTYTHVVRARKHEGGASKMTIRIRTKRNGADTQVAAIECTLTDEFKEFAVSYNYIPSETEWLKDLCFTGDNVEVDSFALYYKPFDYKPETIQKHSIRTANDEYQGLRFAAMVNDESRNAAVEYGFIVALGSSFASADEYTKLVFDAEMRATGTVDGIKYVSGKNYLTTAPGETPTLDKIFDRTGEPFGMDKIGTYFTAVVYNIVDYDVVLVARPYLKISDGTVFYGEPSARCIKDVAESMVEQQYGGNVSAAPDYIQNILG